VQESFAVIKQFRQCPLAAKFKKARPGNKLHSRLRGRVRLCLETLENRLAPAGVVQTDIPLASGQLYHSTTYTAGLVSPFHFDDISRSRSTAILTNTNDGVALANIGFGFNFYGTSYDNVWISSNGLLSFQNTPDDPGYPDPFSTDLTQNAGPNRPIIAVLWDDWSTLAPAGGTVYYTTLGQAGNRQFIVQWDQVSGYASSPSPVTFEVALFEKDGRIEFRYKDVIWRRRAALFPRQRRRCHHRHPLRFSCERRLWILCQYRCPHAERG